MSFLTSRNTPFMAMLISAGLLIGAWIFQYGFGYMPCQMCYWQRWAHWGVLIVALFAYWAVRSGFLTSKKVAWLMALALLVSFGMAFWHVGVEYKWWEGPKGCSVGNITPIEDIDLSKFLEEMDKAKPPACSDAVWSFLGLSMAGWNALISLGGAFLMLLMLKRSEHV